MTLKDIAKEAGVSISTVSRVINQKGASAASKEVQDRVWEIVRRTGYSPNTAARDLKCGNSNSDKKLTRSIACIFARTEDPMKDIFFSTLARGLEEEAFHHNYIVKHLITYVDIDNPAEFRHITGNRVDGAAVLGRCNRQMLSFLKKHFNNVVYSGLNTINAKYDQIICDGYQAAGSVMEKFFELGHTRIAYIGDTKEENRYEGYCASLSAKKIPLRRELVVHAPMTTEGGYQGALRLLEKSRDFTAIFCSNDTVAIGALRALQEKGLKIPGDVSLISIDDIDVVQYITPLLTTIRIPIEELGKMAAKILIDRIEGGHRLPMKILLPFSLVWRETCAEPGFHKRENG